MVREERALAGRSAVGEVAVGGSAPSADVTRLAAGRAWLAVASMLAEAGQAEEAYAAASAGIDELGNAYAGDEVEDDTSLKLLRAEDLHDEDAGRGSVAMQRVLENRLALLAERVGAPQ